MKTTPMSPTTPSDKIPTNPVNQSSSFSWRGFLAWNNARHRAAIK